MFNQYNPYIYQGISRPFSFSNILNNAQKTLNIVNQALPIVKEVKPIVKNARTLFSVAKGFNNISNTNNINTEPIKNNNYKSDNIKNSNNGLNFFI